MVGGLVACVSGGAQLVFLGFLVGPNFIHEALVQKVGPHHNKEK